MFLQLHFSEMLLLAEYAHELQIRPRRCAGAYLERIGISSMELNRRCSTGFQIRPCCGAVLEGRMLTHTYLSLDADIYL